MTTNDNPRSVSTHDEEIGHIRDLTGIVEDLISMMSAGSIGSLKLEYGSLRLSLQSKDRIQKSSAVAENRSEPHPIAQPNETIGAPSSARTVAAPMIGTFYVAPAPNEPPFVAVGDSIVEGQTIGIIEAMKIMNEIAADQAGRVVEIIAGDGQTVEYGSPLIRIEPPDV